ncbi:Cysteine rich repeat-containing protein [Rhizobiales bacterium GAS191]|nr:Cysteine rich repeat-containing protein [Rhizobiales bacterium GAS113]SED90960.1 Cysteine rich repeat-containing protein [Rhizobiales bacterium GAS191]SEE55846.1 Cysteine rich repeat-containing protein [Rhizobiales bacterium GAS188]
MMKTTMIAAFLICASLPASAATITMRSVIEGPCKIEVERFCNHVKPGGGRVQACLKEHLPELSRLCVKGLRAHRNSVNMHLKSRRHARRDPLFSTPATPAPRQ